MQGNEIDCIMKTTINGERHANFFMQLTEGSDDKDGLEVGL